MLTVVFWTGPALAVSLPFNATLEIAGFNMSVTVTGSGVANVSTSGGAVLVTVTGAPWTTGIRTIPILSPGAITRSGFVHGPLSNTSTAAAAGGALQLATPIFIQSGLGSTQTFHRVGADSSAPQAAQRPGTRLAVGLVRPLDFGLQFAA